MAVSAPESQVNILYHGKEESLRLFNTGGDILKYLISDPVGVCPLIGRSIRLVKKLGQGEYGAVFDVSLKGQGTRRYVVKKSLTDDELGVVGCTVTKPYVTSGGTQLEKGDVVCDMVYTEYLIALLIGRIAQSGRSINFFDTFYFATCDGPESKKYHYTFMEKIDRDLDSTLGCVSEKSYGTKVITKAKYPQIMSYLLIQILHAIGVMQSTYQIVHGDLHTGNIFLDVVSPSTTFNDQSLLDAHYYEYRVNGTSIYIPGGKACPFIVKLGDWGFACKYSPRKVMNAEVAEHGMTRGKRMWIPNFYSRSYDVVHVVSVLYELNPSNPFIAGIASFIAGVKEGDVAGLKKFVRATKPRPHVPTIGEKFSHVTPTSMLTSKEVMGEFLVRPDAHSKVVLVGEYSESSEEK